MLPSEFILPFRRGDKVIPKYIEPTAQYCGFIEKALSALNGLNDLRRKEIQMVLEESLVGDFSPKIGQGLAKLMMNRMEFQNIGRQDAVDFREKLFNDSFALWKSNSDFPHVAKLRNHLETKLGLNPTENIDQSIEVVYPDLKNHHKLVSREKITGREILNEFNISQAQGLLIAAKYIQLLVKTTDNLLLRKIYQQIRWHGLAFDAKKISANRMELIIGDPKASFDDHKSLSVELASLFRTIIGLEVPWDLRADVRDRNKDKIRTLSLNSASGYSAPPMVKEDRTEVFTLMENWNEKYSEIALAKPAEDIFQDFLGLCRVPDLLLETKSHKIWLEWFKHPPRDLDKLALRSDPVVGGPYIFAAKFNAAMEEKFSLLELSNIKLFAYRSNLSPLKLKSLLDNILTSPPTLDLTR